MNEFFSNKKIRSENAFEMLQKLVLFIHIKNSKS